MGGIGALVVASALVASHEPATAAQTCDRTATPATLTSVVSAATAGQTICLGAGNYGTWQGTNKAVTLQAQAGASPSMRVSFGSGDSGFTLDGVTGMGGVVSGGAHDFTIRNSTFTDTIDIQATNANILLDHNSHDWNANYTGAANAKIFVWNSPSAFSGVTVSNSSIRNGNLDGIHLGGGAGINVIGNTFANLCDTGTNHTDNLQYEGGTGGRIAGNYVYAAAGCNTQGITSYDGGTNGVTIEDNVVDIRRPWGIELYADHNSIVRHNTLRYYAPSACTFNIACGQIDIDRKSQDPAGSGTQVYDNLATSVGFSNGSTGTAHNNVSGQNAAFVGPLTTYAGFQLSSASSVGRNSASDGTNAGARIGASTTPAPSPSPAPTRTPTPVPTSTPVGDAPAAAVWTAPSGVTVGTPVTLDGTRSQGDGTLSCTWSFEDQAGSTVYETLSGCKLQKVFQVADTKYVKLTVRDADGDVNSSKKSFTVATSRPAPTPTPTPPADTAAKAIWTAPSGTRVGKPVTLDATRSKGDGTLSCTWSFEDANGSTIWESLTGCTLKKTFNVAGTKYVKLIVRDADGDTDSSKQTFSVSS